MLIRLSGAEQLAELSKRLKQAGNRDLRLELYREIRKVTNPIRADVRRSARATLPRRGGLGAAVSRSKITVKRRTSGNTVGIRMIGAGRHDIEAMNRGIVRHNLFGDGRYWFEQAVPPGWWDQPTLAAQPEAAVAIVSAMETVKRKIEG